jgi:hypothetical protein
MKRYLRQAFALAALCGVAALGQSADARSAGTGVAGGEFTCAGMVATIVGTNGPDVLRPTLMSQPRCGQRSNADRATAWSLPTASRPSSIFSRRLATRRSPARGCHSGRAVTIRP